jgi:hypothetical protein
MLSYMLTAVLKAVKMLLFWCLKNSQDAAVISALKTVQDAEKKPLLQRPSKKNYSRRILLANDVQYERGRQQLLV